MKQTIFSIILSTVFSTVFAQVQNGIVREQNSQKKPIADAQIIFSDAVPTTSEQSGKFRLVFSGKKAGDLIFYKEITKKGYEIVNQKELEVLKISNTENIGKDIILAKAGVLDAAKKEYYNVSDKALLAGFNKEKAALKEKLAKTQLTQQAYWDKYTELSKQYEQQQKSLDALADVFARTNFDDVSEAYKKAFELFKDGKIDEALAVLESTDLLNRTKNRLKEKKRIETAGTIIAQQKADNEKGVQEDLQGLQLQAQLYVLTFQVEKAETLYDQVLRLDSTSLDILRGCADFYRDNHRYEKALWLYPKIIAHPQAEEKQKASAYLDNGDMLTSIGQLDTAMKAFLNYKNIHEGLLTKDANASLPKNGLGVAYSRLGVTFTTLGDLKKSIGFL